MLPEGLPTDQIFVCRDCKEDFVFSSGEQRFYSEKSLELPKRCPACREKRRRGQGAFGAQVVSVDSANGLVLCKRCNRPASREISLRLREALCSCCEKKNPYLPRTDDHDLLFYGEWEETFREDSSSGGL